VLLRESRTGSRKQLRFHAEDVHDFVFVASPQFLKKTERVHDSPGEVRLSILYDRHFQAHVDRHLRAAKEGLLELEARLGMYPYSELTIVLPPPGAEGAGDLWRRREREPLPALRPPPLEHRPRTTRRVSRNF
jgi:hypothetical protein